MADCQTADGKTDDQRVDDRRTDIKIDGRTVRQIVTGRQLNKFKQPDKHKHTHAHVRQ